MDVKNEISDESLEAKYGEPQQRKRKRIPAEKLLKISKARPARYCVKGYQSFVYQAVIDRNKDVIKKYLRVTWSALHQLAGLIPVKHHGWNILFEISVFLFWLACGASYRVTGQAFMISRYTVRDIVHKMLDECVRLLPLVIKYPPPETYIQIGEGFNKRAKTNIFTNAVGAIDATHIKISVPTKLRNQYINSKNFTSIQLQAVCGSNGGKFYSICTGWPGSVHDQRVLRNSQLYKDHLFPPQGYYLLGDSSYACTLNPIAIITPFKRNTTLTTAEKRFNNVHRKARNIIECSFGRLKQRWRSLFNGPLELKMINSIKVTAAACVMHNICLNDGLDFTEAEDNGMDEADDAPSDEQFENIADDGPGLHFRNNLVQQLQESSN